MARWIAENTRDPKNPLRNWSYLNHEWQLGVLDCEKNLIAVQKSAQVGCSELIVRLLIGVSTVSGPVNCIYVLPSAGFARKFVASRVDPVIKNSPIVRSLVSRETNNLEIKQIGDSFVFFGGAQNESQSISTPASVLLIDELNFCLPSILSVYSSRLEHCLPGEDYRVRFSTPTLPGFGISKLLEDGDYRQYLCRHDGCGQWVSLSPWADIVVPGFPGALIDFTKRDAESPEVHVKQAWVKCPSCGDPIGQENLANPEKRIWVAKYPARDEASFQVTPLDCPVINPPAKIAGKVKTYSRHVDFLNYGLGTPASDAESMVLLDALERGRVEAAVNPNVGATGTLMGVDVGTVSHLVVGKAVGGRLRTIWAERILQTGENVLQETIKTRMKQFGTTRLVIDSQPDLTVPRAMVSWGWMGQVLASYFVTGGGPKTLDLMTVDEEQGVVKVARTRTFDEFVKDLNNNTILLLREHPEIELIISHLSKLRRIKGEDEADGQIKARWVSTDDEDHYAFALLYLYVAHRSMDSASAYSTGAAAVLASKLISRARLRVVK